MSRNADRAERTEYELLDAGDGRRLERFGARVLDRPAPAAASPRMDSGAWRSADLRFDDEAGWTGVAALEPWPLTLDGLTLELRPTASGGVGIYPEHLANLGWLTAQVASRATGDSGDPPSVLNLFAHTGLVTLAAARAGAAIAHVDAARGAVAWARRNAELSGLAERPIRWLVDDATSFVAREARRNRRYNGIVLDPPSFGHSGSKRWNLADELPELLQACSAVATDDAFVLLSAHTIGIDGHVLHEVLSDTFRRPGRKDAIEVIRLALDAASGGRLELGWAIRLWPTRLGGPSRRWSGRPTDRLPTDGS